MRIYHRYKLFLQILNAELCLKLLTKESSIEHHISQYMMQMCYLFSFVRQSTQEKNVSENLLHCVVFPWIRNYDIILSLLGRRSQPPFLPLLPIGHLCRQSQPPQPPLLLAAAWVAAACRSYFWWTRSPLVTAVVPQHLTVTYRRWFRTVTAFAGRRHRRLPPPTFAACRRRSPLPSVAGYCRLVTTYAGRHVRRSPLWQIWSLKWKGFRKSFSKLGLLHF